MQAKVNNALKLYWSCSFMVHDMHADMEFECVQHNYLPTVVNLTPHDVHIGKVECSICTIKECIWADVHSMPFKQLPKLMIVELVC